MIPLLLGTRRHLIYILPGMFIYMFALLVLTLDPAAALGVAGIGVRKHCTCHSILLFRYRTGSVLNCVVRCLIPTYFRYLCCSHARLAALFPTQFHRPSPATSLAGGALGSFACRGSLTRVTNPVTRQTTTAQTPGFFGGGIPLDGNSPTANHRVQGAWPPNLEES